MTSVKKEEPISYPNVVIKQEIDLPDLNLTENGELDHSLIKQEPLQEQQIKHEQYAEKLHQENGMNFESDLRGELYQCSVCHEKFINESDLLKHYQVFGKEKKVKCKKCNKSFPDQLQLTEHMQFHLQQKLKCKKCNKSFPDQLQLTEHIQFHLQPYKCNLCQEEFRHKQTLIKHLKKPTHNCSKCQKRFCHLQSLKKHMNSFHLNDNINNGPFKCNHCHERFYSKSRLARHLGECAESILFFKLKREACKTNRNLIEHLQIDLDEKIKAFEINKVI